VTYNEVRLDSVVISGAGSTATVAGALVVTGVTTATGLQINGATAITGSLTASTYLVMPARWIQKQATSMDVPADNSYSNIGLTHTFTALAGRMYDINCDTEAVVITIPTNISHSRVDVSVWDGTTMLSSQRSSLVSVGFVSLGSRWTGTLTAGSRTITCKYYLRGKYTMHANHQCIGTGDILRGFVGTADQCKAKCDELKCTGFIHVTTGGSKCYFRSGTLQAPFPNPYGPLDNRDCYVPSADYPVPELVLKITNSSTLRIVETVNGGTLP